MPETVQNRSESDYLTSVCRALAEKGYLGPLKSGNVSIRSEDGDFFYVTKRGQDLQKDPFSSTVLIVKQTEFVEGYEEKVLEVATTEWPLHKAVYDCRPNTRCVIHVHSHYATAASILCPTFLPFLHYHQAFLGEDQTPVIPFELPGSEKLVKLVTTGLHVKTKALLLANHGCLVFGESTRETLSVLDVLEEVCKLYVQVCQDPKTGNRISNRYKEPLVELFRDYR